MAGRRKKPEVNRRNWHAARVQQARTPREVLWAWCHWLVAEAWHAGPDGLAEATRVVSGQTHALIEERRTPTP